VERSRGTRLIVIEAVKEYYDSRRRGSGGVEFVTCVHVPVTVHRSGQCRISYV